MAPGMIPVGSVNQITNNCDKFEEDAKNFKKEYTKIKQLGKGGFGEVFLHTRRIDGVKVAIKFVDKAKSEKVSLDNFLVFFICMGTKDDRGSSCVQSYHVIYLNTWTRPDSVHCDS